jgi:hypothetical protein
MNEDNLSKFAEQYDCGSEILLRETEKAAVLEIKSGIQDQQLSNVSMTKFVGISLEEIHTGNLAVKQNFLPIVDINEVNCYKKLVKIYHHIITLSIPTFHRN